MVGYNSIRIAVPLLLMHTDCVQFHSFGIYLWKDQRTYLLHSCNQFGQSEAAVYEVLYA